MRFTSMNISFVRTVTTIKFSLLLKTLAYYHDLCDNTLLLVLDAVMLAPPHGSNRIFRLRSFLPSQAWSRHAA